jgi:hypothetical protein
MFDGRARGRPVLDSLAAMRTTCVGVPRGVTQGLPGVAPVEFAQSLAPISVITQPLMAPRFDIAPLNLLA